jgi:methionyl-tRNA synthetase
MADPFYITTAINYPNGPPHIGHAYEAIATDAIARFHRLSGRDVFFQTGTDEHGLKMAQTARERGVEPARLADEMSSIFKRMDERLLISFDRFIRTTEPAHHEASRAIWRAMADQGDLYLGRYEGWYSVRDEAYYDEKELVDGEGGRLSPQGTPVEWTVEESWFFRLSAYQDRLLAHYRENPGFIRPEGRRNEVLRFVEGGLSDLSVSRTSFDWGVKVPGDERHVIYVWLDALTNYLTGIGYPDVDSKTYRRYWPADVHIIGKDVVRFHAVYWPAFLMSAGVPLPRMVFGHGHVLLRGEKMSKSAGNVVDPDALIDRFGTDAVRYFFLREVPFGQDGGYSPEGIAARANADLANGLGNLAQRCLAMIARNCGGRVPAKGSLTPAEDSLLRDIEVHWLAAQEAMEELGIHRAIEAIWRGVGAANVYFAEQAPWSLRKSDAARADTVLYAAAEAVRRLAISCRWIVPRGADLLLDQLGQPVEAREFGSLDRWLEPGLALPAPQGVFPRLDAPAQL